MSHAQKLHSWDSAKMFSWQGLSFAAVALLATLAPSFGGEWCENFETDSGTFWRQDDYQGGAWLHTTYSDETAQGHDVPKPPTGEDGMLLLRPFEYSIVAWSMLVSPELTFNADASMELDYWLWFNVSQPHTPVSFMLFRRVNGIEDSEAFLNISAFANVKQSHWSSIEVGLKTSDTNRFQLAIYGFMAGDGPVMTSNIGIDRVILRGVNGDNPCGGNSTLPPTPTLAPTTPMTAPTDPPTRPPTTHPYDFFCPAQYGLFKDPADCHYFYQCSNWTPYHMVCPSNLVYNPATERCDYSKNVPGC